MLQETDNIYCYPGTDILKNKFDIRNQAKLDVKERYIAIHNTHLFRFEKLPGSFNLDYLKNIHKYIFQELYPFAGALRTVDISKGIMFARSEYIKPEADRIFKQLKDENYLKGLGPEKLAERLSYYNTEINMLHPFREGNGRTIREFTSALARHNGYDLDFTKMDRSDYMRAMIKSPSDTTDLSNLIYKVLEKDTIIEIKKNMVQRFEKEFPAIQYASNEIISIIDVLDSKGSYSSISHIKKEYKEIGRRVESNTASKDEIHDFELLKKTVTGLNEASKIHKNHLVNPKPIDFTLSR